MAIAKSTRQKFRSALIFTIIGALLVAPVFQFTNTSALSRACQNSPACVAAAEAEVNANNAAADAAANASAYQRKVNQLNAEIAAKTAEILETQANVDELNAQIAETEKELAADQAALAEMLINMHFDSDSEPIHVLAGSSSISDLAEKQARAEVAQQEITAAAVKVKTTKQQLENDKIAVEALLAQQQTARSELEASRASQQELVAKYESDTAAYEAVAEEAKQQKLAAERAEQDAHPDLYRGIGTYSGADTYYWQNDCPDAQDDYATYYNGELIGGLVCECVSYAGWKMYQYSGYAIAWGNAATWDDVGRMDSSYNNSDKFYVDNTPEANSIGQYHVYPYGHVFWVESVNADGSINISEYNNYYSSWLVFGQPNSIDYYTWKSSWDYRYGMGQFGTQVISASVARTYNYIHLK